MGREDLKRMFSRKQAGSLVFVVGVAAALALATSASGSSQGPPVNESLPAISGSAVQGQTLLASTGGWEGAQPMAFAYQWRRCDSVGSTCADIVGATTQHYLLAAADVGHRLRIAVGASNAAGAAAVLSSPTEVVAAAPATTTTTTTTAPVPSKNSCKRDGWRSFTNPRFRNQGQCVRFFVHQHHGDARGGIVTPRGFDFSPCRQGCKQHITIVKDFVPNPNNAVTVDLLLNGVIVAGNIGDGGTTGPIGVEPGNYTVGEQGASLTHYTGSIICTGETAASSLPHVVSVAKRANVVCTITNTFH